jgi:dTDP-4-dehydrorhamnose 3,5-epimerase
MHVQPTALPDVLLIEPRVFTDERGFFFESFNARRLAERGLPTQFVQDNHSHSVKGTLRGLHYQLRNPQGKLVRVVRGEAFDVAVDIRRGSPTFGRWVGITLTAERHQLLWIPPGYAHGFCALTDHVDFLYKVTTFYDEADDRGIRWDDPHIGIQWPVSRPLLSARDQSFPLLTSDRGDLPDYER